MNTMIKISTIRMDGGTQVRAAKDPGTVRDYAEAMHEGATFPPVVLFQEGLNYWLADGFHRVEAATLAGLQEISADVHQGTLRDALVCALASNSSHGLRMTNADKRKVVGMALDDGEMSEWSDREIGRWVGVSNRFVSNMRAERVCTVHTSGVQTVCTWSPTEGHSSTAQAEGWTAFVMPSDHAGFFYAMVIRPQDQPQPHLEGIKKPIRADMVPSLIRSMGFPLDAATWTVEPVGTAPDVDEGLDFENRWSWPHLLFDSRQEWIEKRWRHHPEEGAHPHA